MKTLKYILPIFFTLLLISCSSDDEVNDPINEVQALLKVEELTNDTHIIELYTVSGSFSQGYNDITIRIKDKTTENFVENAIMTWKPIMHMTTMMHSCPKSDLAKVVEKETIYNGYIVFQMAENQNEGWDLTINYTIDGVDYMVVDDIGVPMFDKKNVTTFMGANDVRYVLALIDPQDPDVKINDITVGLFKMENMMSFPVIENYTIKLDPRMPSMGNHSSPNNEDLTYNSQSNLYNGKLSLTMTGYWKLNLMLYNDSDDLLKGEEITSENEGSSLYLELEF